MLDNDLLHDIDKRVAVLAALSEEHAESTYERFDQIQSDLSQVKLELSKLRIRVASIAAVISLVVGVVVKWLNIF